MKKLFLIIVSVLFIGCGTRKAELERQVNVYKSEIQNYQKKQLESDSAIESIQKSFNQVIQNIVTSREIFQKQLEEMYAHYEKSNSELSEDFSISNAVGTVKVTDKKGNQYEIPSAAGTTINKTSNERLVKENAELQKAFRNEYQKSENLKSELNRNEKIESNLRATVKKKETEISELNQKISDLSKSKVKNTESKRPSFAWYVLAFVLGMAALRFLQTQFPNLIQYLNNRR